MGIKRYIRDNVLKIPEILNAGENGCGKCVNENNVNLLEAGLEVKYLIMLLCITGIRQQQRTTAFTAMIPKTTAFSDRLLPTRKKHSE